MTTPTTPGPVPGPPEPPAPATSEVDEPQVDEIDDDGDEDFDNPKKARAKFQKLRQENMTWRRQLREREAQVKDLTPKATEFDKIAAERQTAEEKAAAALAKAEDRAKNATTRAVRGEIKALAAELFTDPNDPADNLDVTTFVDDAGEIDTDGIKTALSDLLKRKPHWGKTDPTTPRSPKPDRSQGSSGTGQLSVEAQIAEAQAKGDVQRVIKLQTQKLFQPQQR